MSSSYRRCTQSQQNLSVGSTILLFKWIWPFFLIICLRGKKTSKNSHSKLMDEEMQTEDCTVVCEPAHLQHIIRVKNTFYLLSCMNHLHCASTAGAVVAAAHGLIFKPRQPFLILLYPYIIICNYHQWQIICFTVQGGE